MSPHEIAVRFTDEHGYFAAETPVYRLLKALDMITSPKFIVIKAADTFHTKTTDRLVPIGVLSQRSGCSADTIRFYEKVFVLPQARRTEAGRRVYAGSDIAVTFVRRARDLGFSIDEIRSLLALAESETGACDRVRSVASDHLDSTAGKIADLQTMQVVLADLIAGCERGDGTTCPLLTQLWDC